MQRGISFEWDPVKDRSNRSKHGVSFEEAVTVFFDENALQILDLGHSEEEERFVMLGMSSRLRLLVVCHTYRAHERVVRIFSTRRATRRERTTYAGRLS